MKLPDDTNHNKKSKKKKPDYISHPYHPLRKVIIAWQGFWYVISNDLSVTYKVIISIPLLLVSLYFQQYTNFLLILVATGGMLSMEIMNSCVELLCDFQDTSYNEKIKVIKDVAAAAAGLSIGVWLIVLGYELWSLIAVVV